MVLHVWIQPCHRRGHMGASNVLPPQPSNYASKATPRVTWNFLHWYICRGCIRNKIILYLFVDFVVRRAGQTNVESSHLGIGGAARGHNLSINTILETTD